MADSTTTTFDAFNYDFEIKYEVDDYVSNFQFYDNSNNIWHDDSKCNNQIQDWNENNGELAFNDENNFEMLEEINYDYHNEVTIATQQENYIITGPTPHFVINADQVENLMEKIQNVKGLWAQKQEESVQIINLDESSSFTQQEQDSIFDYLIQMSNK
jgi:hypothetical protein